MKKIFSGLTALFAALLLPLIASAHEVYVLPHGEVAKDLAIPAFNVFDALKNQQDLHLTIIITACVTFVMLLNFIFRHSPLGDRVRKIFEKGEGWGTHFVRLAVAISLFYSAYTWSFLGPELSLHIFPFASIVRTALFVVSFLFFFNIATEAAALVALVIFGLAVYKYDWYMFTYFNYFAEILVLLFITSRKSYFWEKYRSAIIRIGYGVALGYAAIYVKFLHPWLTLDVVNDYNLTRFHLLFPHDPLLVVLGAGLAELAIATFIFLGFELRLTVLISLFYITLSVLFFREQVWPHLILYGISFDILFSKETFSLDNFFDKYIRFGKKA